jgi:hypothetical protein
VWLMTGTKLYGEPAHWGPIFSAKEDYAGEAACFRDILLTAITPPPKTVVEFGCGAGTTPSMAPPAFAGGIPRSNLAPNAACACRSSRAGG